jgi:hypothetical protein
MRPTPARVLLAVLAVAAVAASLLTSQLLFVPLGVVAALLLATSVVGGARRPLIRGLLRLRGRRVNVEVWGAPPPGAAADLVLDSVNVLGAGLHLYFTEHAAGATVHLKVAQPGRFELAPGSVRIESARYIQWSGKKVPVHEGARALTVALRSGAD